MTAATTAIAAIQARWPGAEVVDVRAHEPSTEVAALPAPAPVLLPDMIREMQNEAERIEIAQAVLVADGYRTAPAPDQARRAQVCRAIVRLVELIAGDELVQRRLRDLYRVRLAAEAAAAPPPDDDDEAETTEGA